MTLRKKLLFTCALLLSQQAFACQDQLAGIVKRAYPHAAFNDGGFDLPGATLLHIDLNDGVSCKKWPAHPEWTLVSVTLQHMPADPRDPEADLEILVVDSATGAIGSRLVEDGMLDSDAMRTGLLGFDTARYGVTPGSLVFGIRTSSTGGAHGWSIMAETLRLYALKAAALTRILELQTSSESARGPSESRRVHKGSANENDLEKRTIAPATQVHNGLNDLLVQTIRTERDSVEREGRDDRITVSRHQSSERYIFDGDVYVKAGSKPPTP